MSKKEPALTKKDLRKVARRWMPMAVTTFNYESQLAGSVVYSMSEALRKIYPNDDEYVKALNNHYKYFNCMPWLANLIFGVTLAIEDNEGIESIDAVQNFKTSLMGPLSGIGDTIFWVLIPTILGSISGYMAIEGNPIGVIAWIIINIGFMFIRYRFVELGYNQGIKLVTTLGDKVSKFTEAASILGLVVVGSLIPTAVKVGTPLKFNVGEVGMEIQPMLDKILPALIPVLLTWGTYKMIKENKMKVTTIIFLIIVLCMFAAAFNILG